MDEPFEVCEFRSVLRGLRLETGLTVLAAGEATQYRNYERWESGATRVGAVHLANIATAFELASDDLVLLIFAWLVDRLVPADGDRERRIETGVVCKWLAELPRRLVEVDPAYAELVDQAGSCTEVALTCLLARYGDRDRVGHWTLRFPPTPRTAPLDVEVGLLSATYGWALWDAADLVIEMMQQGWDPDATGIERELARGAAAMVTDPRVIEGLAAEARAAAEASVDSDPGVIGVLAAVGSAGPEMVALTMRVRGETRRLMESALGHRVTHGAVRHLLQSVASGDLEPLTRLVTTALNEGRDVAEADTGLTKALIALGRRLAPICEPGLAEEIGEAAAAEQRGAFSLALESIAASLDSSRRLTA